MSAKKNQVYAEPVTAAELAVGEVYFSLQFMDESLTIPILEPWVYLGRNLRNIGEDRLYFQSYESRLRGVSLEGLNDDEEVYSFQVPKIDNVPHFFQFEKALNLLNDCAERRKRREPRT
jgi:hypothetical protein